MDGVTLVPRGPLRLGHEVVLGAVDVAAVGARVLLSLQPPNGWAVREVGVDISGLEPPQASPKQDGGGDITGMRPVLTPADVEATDGVAPAVGAAGGAGDRQPAPLVLVRNLYAPGAPPDAADAVPQVSLVALNAAVPEGAQAEVAAALLDLLAAAPAPAAEAAAGGEGSAAGERPRALVLVSAMLLQHLAQPAALYQLSLNGAKPLDPALPPLPTTTAAAGAPAAAAAAAAARVRVRDGQLAALLHVAAASGTPVACLLAPGHKPPASTPPDLPDSAAACDALGGALAAALGLRYDATRCRAVRASYKWFVPEKAAGSDVMYL